MIRFLDMLPETVFETDTELNLVFVNKRAFEQFGYKPEDLKAGLNGIEMVPEFERDRVAKCVERIMAGEKMGLLEFTGLRKDGSVFPMLIEANRIEQGGRVEGIRGFAIDISERKREQEQLCEQKERAEQSSQELQQANETLKSTYKKLIETSREAGMAEVATDVLHNVGNVLNSVNVSANLITEKVKHSEIPNLERLAEMIEDHSDDLTEFLTSDERGKHIPLYIIETSRQLSKERNEIMDKLVSLARNIEHIKQIVKMQQTYAKVSGVETAASLAELVDDAIAINQAGLIRHAIDLHTDYQYTDEIMVDKQKVLQILVNLIGNAKYALSAGRAEHRELTVRIHKAQQDEKVLIEVIDNGIGIRSENMTRIFQHGFTTKKHGHGFGLHSGAIAAREMGGKLKARSDGPDRGAKFTLELPLKLSPVQAVS